MQVLELPALADLTSRSFSGGEDYEHVARLVVIDARADGGQAVMNGDEVKAQFDTTENLHLERDCAFVEASGRPVGYVVTRWWQEVDGPRIYRHMCKLEPEWRGRGIGTAMLHWAQAHLAEIAAGHDAPAKVYRTDADDHAVETVELLKAEGYLAIEHHAELVRPHLDGIPEAPLPAGLEIRPVTEDQLRAIWEADVEAFRDHWGFVEPTEKDWQAFCEFPLRDESLWKVAWDGARVAGQVRSFINEEENVEYDRRRGWTEFISTAREWRGRGVATALICESLREVRRRGMEEAALGVHLENPHGAYRLYQSLGFEVVRSGATYEKPVEPS
jgi:ribosomal protein S18 acetylase RimI-like enzyme